MTIRHLLIALLLALATIISGCANYTPRIAASEQPGVNDAYLYGRFSIETRKEFFGIDGYTTMGFAIECVDGKRYVIRFDKDTPLQAVKIKPSVCSWVQIVYSNADGQLMSQKPAPAGSMSSMKIKRSQAYYFGDFHAAFTSQGCGYRTACLNWRIDGARDNFSSASDELNNTFPRLATLPKSKVDSLLLR